MQFKQTSQLLSFIVLILLPLVSMSSEPDSKLLKSCPITRSFDFPVGSPNAKAYYNAQAFGKNDHLGDDWNGVGGGNSDLGDPVYSIANGIVASSKNLKGGWGNVVRIYHNYGTTQNPLYIESLYAHLNKRLVTVGTVIKKGSKIGTIGNVNGMYWAHLHLEIRNALGMPIGEGYAKDTSGYIDPTKFIHSHRKIKKNTLK